MRRGLTTRQAVALVDPILAAAEQASAGRAEPRPGPRRAPMTPTEAMIADATALAFRATRLHARLLERPLASLGPELEQVVARRLVKISAYA